MTNKKLSTKPYKGARDFYPEEMRVQNYILNIWRETALSYGFEEYDFPLLERCEIYEAKSGEELVNRQLYSFEDRGGRRVAIRPEKTPSVARLVAARSATLPRPIRWFNIGNCWRYEKPQRGRGREFYQFDCDIFGIDDITAEVEAFSIPIEVMKKLGATGKMFEIRANNRKFAEFYLKEVVELSGDMSNSDTQLYKVTKSIDAKPKISDKEFVQMLEKAGVSKEQIEKLQKYLEAGLDFVSKFQGKNDGADELVKFFNLMEAAGYSEYIKYSPEIMRGLDYYTGMVIEQFDLNPKNNRSMYGGGRYADLTNLYTDEKINGVGFAMGDMTLLEFMKGWNLVPKLAQKVDFFVTVWPGDNEKYLAKTFEVARKIRESGKSAITSLKSEKSISQQLDEANKRGAKRVIITGPQEIEKGTVTVKNMETGEQDKIAEEKFLAHL